MTTASPGLQRAADRFALVLTAMALVLAGLGAYAADWFGPARFRSISAVHCILLSIACYALGVALRQKLEELRRSGGVETGTAPPPPPR